MTGMHHPFAIQETHVRKRNNSVFTMCRKAARQQHVKKPFSATNVETGNNVENICHHDTRRTLASRAEIPVPNIPLAISARKNTRAGLLNRLCENRP